MGAILRSLRRRKKQTRLTRSVTKLIDNGKLIPSRWVLQILDEQLRRVPPERGVVLDGSGRRLGEAKALFRILKKYRRRITHVIFLDITRSETIKRLSKRWLCSKCHRVLTMGVDIRSPHSRCPHCGGKIFQRDDEKPEAIAKRLSYYHRETKPVIRYFEQLGILTRIDGEHPIPAVYRKVERAFHEYRA